MNQEKYEPTESEMIKAESSLTNEQEAFSSAREADYNKLTPEQQELISKCDLALSELGGSYMGTSSLEQTVKGVIDGKSVELVCGPEHSDGPRVYKGLVDGTELAAEESERLFTKYFPIAWFQTRASSDQVTPGIRSQIEKGKTSSL